MSPPPPSPPNTLRNLACTSTPVLAHDPHPATTPAVTSASKSTLAANASSLASAPTSLAPPPPPAHGSPPSSTYASKAGAVIECSYRPSSPGIETPEETRKRLRLGSTPLGDRKKREIREMQRRYLGEEWADRKERGERRLALAHKALTPVSMAPASVASAPAESEPEGTSRETETQLHSTSRGTFVLVERGGRGESDDEEGMKWN